MKLKICGMKYRDNILDVAQLQPEFMGFIFYEKSSRFFDGEIPDLPQSIKKVGVFVNPSDYFITETVLKHNLQAIQLHGKESPEFIKLLRRKLSAIDKSTIDIIKVFSIRDHFDFSKLEVFESICDYYLFDTKGELPGGNGYRFDWSVLKSYPSNKPYFLSGGIGWDDLDRLSVFQKSPESEHCYAIDVNSKFEIEAGLKNKNRLKTFIDDL